MSRYAALIDTGPDGAHGVVFPDLSGCTATGKTADQAYRRAIEAVGAWIGDAERDGERPPRARTLKELLADREVRKALVAGAALVMVPVLRDSGKAVKANLSLDLGTLQAIDAAAEAHGLSRSGFVDSAAREKILRGT